MRHNRGRHWARFPEQSGLNQRNSTRNNFTFYNFRNSNRPAQKVNNFTYIGRCRCGYGPNAYYQTSNGRILQYSQINQIKQPLQIKPITKPKELPKTITKELLPPQVETSRICSRCGSQVRVDAYFCTECGNELTNSPYMTKKEQLEFLKEKLRDLKGQIKILKKKKENLDEMKENGKK